MTLGLKLGNRIKGIIALSGYIPAFVKEEYEISRLDGVRHLFRTASMIKFFHYEWGIDAEEFYKQHGAVTTFSSYPEGHTVSQRKLQ